MSYLLDTNVLSEWRKPVPNTGVVDWFGRVPVDELYLSVVTVGEIRRGVGRLQRRGDHRQATAIEAWLADTRRRFVDRLLPITADVAERWGQTDAGGPIPTADGLIAATATVHGLTVVTRNTKDFEPTGVGVLNPFTDD